MTVTQTISELVGARLPLILPTVAVILAVVLFQNVFRANPLRSIPVAGEELGGDEKRRQEYLRNATAMYVDGYKKVCGAQKRRMHVSTRSMN